MTNSNHVRSSASSLDRLENQMLLLDWMHDMLGYESTKDLLRDMKGVEDGFMPDGFSYIYRKLQSRGNLVKVSSTNLACYDANIHEYVTRINGGREESITLQYFQYLAVLYAEIFLDYYFSHRDELLRSLNELVNQINANISSYERRHGPFAETDLKKIAFLDGHGQRQDTDHAHKLLAVPALQQRAIGQHTADYAQRGVEQATSGRVAGLQHTSRTLCFARKRRLGDRPRHGSGDRDYQACPRKARWGSKRSG